jgi:hypothetical protein
MIIGLARLLRYVRYYTTNSKKFPNPARVMLQHARHRLATRLLLAVQTVVHRKGNTVGPTFSCTLAYCRDNRTSITPAVQVV